MIILYFGLFFSFVLFFAVLDRKFFFLHELNKYSGDPFLPLGTSLFLRGTLFFMILALFIFTLILSWQYPMILKISSDFYFGKMYLLLFLFFNFGFIFVSIINHGFEGYKKLFGFWLKLFERLWLVGLKKEVLENYGRHVSWRWSVINRKFSIWLREKKLPSIHLVRILIIILAGVATVLFANFVIDGLIVERGRRNLLTLDYLLKAPQALTGVLVVLSIPVAFVVWFFRDQNNLWQLENSRKDINLKDFQKLAEWAAGLHLPEDKVIRTTKTNILNKLVGLEEKIETTTSEEKTNSTESTEQPTSGVIKTYSRRDGAVALQVSAIYQMQAFLRGDFGTHFQRPAFHLLKSVWMALTQGNIRSISKISGSDLIEYKENVGKWRKEILGLTSEGVGSALTLVLSGRNGQILRSNAVDLPHIALAGWQGMLPGRNYVESNVVFDGLDFQGAQLQGINLKQGYLAKICLLSAKLFGADLAFSHLQGADLRWVDARFANLNGARMQGALLNGGIFVGADLLVVDLRGASLDGAQLQSASLNGAKLEGARLLNIVIDDYTDFTSATVDKSTIVAVASLKPGLHNSQDQKFPDDFVVDEKETFMLLEKLAKKGLVLPQ